MSEIKYAESEDGRRVTWSDIESGDTCQEFPIKNFLPVKSMHVSGVFGAAGSVGLLGRQVGTGFTPLPLTDGKTGAAVAVTEEGLAIPWEETEAIQPVVSGGDGTTLLNIIVRLGS